MTKRTIARSLLVTAAMGIAAPAYAQQAAATQNPQTPPAATDVEASSLEDDSIAVGDIVVTANRVSSLASKTPIALSAIEGSALRNANITNPVGLADAVPNLALMRNRDGLQITIRGVTSNDNTEKGDPSAAFLLDGVYIARPQVQEVSFYDIQRVEVLRGPQGTLYGRNTTAGVVNVITNQPSNRFEAAANAGYGNYDTRQADAMVNVPLGDTVAVRFSGAYDRRDNYLLRGTSPFRISPFRDTLSGRLQVLFKPTDDLSILLRGDYSRLKGNTTSFVSISNFFAAAPTGVDPRYIGGSSEKLRTITVPQVVEANRDGETYGISGEVNWNIGPATLTYLGSYRKYTSNDNNNFGLGAYYRFATAFDIWQNSQELRLAFNDLGRLKLQVGGYYFKEKGGINATFYNIAFIAPIYGFPQKPVIAESYAAFGQAVFSITDRLRLTGGARYSHDDKTRFGKTIVQQTPTFNPATDSQTLNAAETVSSKVTWRAGLDYDLNSRALLYGSIATGYKAGGFNDGCEAGSSYQGLRCVTPTASNLFYYKPETLTAYEIGFKTRTADNKLRFTGSAFWYDYKDLQLTTIQNDAKGNPVTLTTNAAKARVKGVELESTLAPTSRNRVDLSFAYLDTKYVSYLPLGTTGPNYAGRPLDRSPKIVATASYTYTLPLGNGGHLAANARIRLSDSYVITVFGAAQQYRQPGYTRTDASLTYAAAEDRYYIQGFVSNLEDKVLLTSTDSFGNASVSDPLTYGVRAGFKF